jgi:hypothetical protein
VTANAFGRATMSRRNIIAGLIVMVPVPTLGKAPTAKAFLDEIYRHYVGSSTRAPIGPPLQRAIAQQFEFDRIRHGSRHFRCSPGRCGNTRVRRRRVMVRRQNRKCYGKAYPNQQKKCPLGADSRDFCCRSCCTFVPLRKKPNQSRSHRLRFIVLASLVSIVRRFTVGWHSIDAVAGEG